MDITTIRDRVLLIERLRDDDERAHAAEDQLYIDFIQSLISLATTPQDIRAKAAEVLKTQNIYFSRWTA